MLALTSGSKLVPFVICIFSRTRKKTRRERKKLRLPLCETNAERARSPTTRRWRKHREPLSHWDVPIQITGSFFSNVVQSAPCCWNAYVPPVGLARKLCSVDIECIVEASIPTQGAEETENLDEESLTAVKISHAWLRSNRIHNRIWIDCLLI